MPARARRGRSSTSTTPTSILQRRVVFRLDKDGITKIAVDAAQICLELESTVPGTEIRYEYSPESFTGTELDYAVEICAAVMDVIEPTPERPIILNLPATVEMYTPNIYADAIEWFHRNVPRRDSVILSLHPHNDRGTAVAAAEFGVMAGADRVEGTLFGNGERTGNVDVVNLAMNLFSQGVDPELDITDIDALRRVAEHCNRLPVEPRHPVRRRPRLHVLLGLAPGRHQEGHGGPAARLRGLGGPVPADRPQARRPQLRGRHPGQQPVGQGRRGLHHEDRARHGPAAPAPDRVQPLHQDHHRGQRHRDHRRGDVGRLRGRVPAGRRHAVRLAGYETTSDDGGVKVKASLATAGGQADTIAGEGNGPISALVHALRQDLGVEVDVLDYAEHALGAGEEATAVAYVEVRSHGEVRWGVGMDPNITTASMKAVLSALERLGVSFDRTADLEAAARS